MIRIAHAPLLALLACGPDRSGASTTDPCVDSDPDDHCWCDAIDGDSVDIHALGETPSGAILVAGARGGHGWLRAYAPDGVVAWTRFTARPILGVAGLSDGTVAIVDTSIDGATLRRVTVEGEERWGRTLEGGAAAGTLRVTSDDALVVGGWIGSSSRGNRPVAWLAAHDGEGGRTWEAFEPDASVDSFTTAVAVSPAGHVAAAGWADVVILAGDVARPLPSGLIALYDGLGARSFRVREADGAPTTTFEAVAVAADGTTVAIGTAGPPSRTTVRTSAHRPDGTPLWDLVRPADGDGDRGAGIAPASDGGFHLGGSVGAFGDLRPWLGRVDPEGLGLEGDVVLPAGDVPSSLETMVLASDGALLLAGAFAPTDRPTSAWVCRIPSD